MTAEFLAMGKQEAIEVIKLSPNSNVIYTGDTRKSSPKRFRMEELHKRLPLDSYSGLTVKGYPVAYRTL